MHADTRPYDASSSPEGSLCSGNERFTGKSVVKRYRLQGETIVLQHHPDVFPPSAFGLRLGEHVDFTDCRRAIDIGTGTGLFAILAALSGVGEVKATDTSEIAVALAAGNAGLSGASAAIDVRQGSFFAGFEGDFDVIVANLPQEILPPDYRQSLNGRQLRAIDGGGAGGNAILLDFLDLARGRMRPSSRLYTFVDTLTDYSRALAAIEANYASRLLWDGLTPTKAFVGDNIAFFSELREAGTISIAQDADGRWRARQMIFELRLPDRCAAAQSRS